MNTALVLTLAAVLSTAVAASDVVGARMVSCSG
jgi:hypothetical protein